MKPNLRRFKWRGMKNGKTISKLVFLSIVVLIIACAEKRPKVYPSETISHGEAYFLNECARCHGDRGEGNRDKDVPRLRNGRYVFEEVKNSMLYPEGVMPEFDDVPDSVIQQIVTYINKN